MDWWVQYDLSLFFGIAGACVGAGPKLFFVHIFDIFEIQKGKCNSRAIDIAYTKNRCVCFRLPSFYKMLIKLVNKVWGLGS